MLISRWCLTLSSICKWTSMLVCTRLSCLCYIRIRLLLVSYIRFLCICNIRIRILLVPYVRLLCICNIRIRILFVSYIGFLSICNVWIRNLSRSLPRCVIPSCRGFNVDLVNCFPCGTSCFYPCTLS